MQDNGISFRALSTAEEALDHLSKGDVDAVVYDAPLMKYLIGNSYKGRLKIIPGHFVAQNYAFGIAAGSALTEHINQSLLKVTGDQRWEQILDTYIGE